MTKVIKQPPLKPLDYEDDVIKEPIKYKTETPTEVSQFL